jgi:hypothetical protein
LCGTIESFTKTLAESGKVLISETVKAGGALTGATDSSYLMKACALNGDTNDAANSPNVAPLVADNAHLVNMF